MKTCGRVYLVWKRNDKFPAFVVDNLNECFNIVNSEGHNVYWEEEVVTSPRLNVVLKFISYENREVLYTVVGYDLKTSEERPKKE